jgi:hypothetical protein
MTQTPAAIKELISRPLPEENVPAPKRKPGRPKGSTPFGRVIRARQRLAKEADYLASLIVKAAEVAAAKGKHGPAAWALEHVAVADAQTGEEMRPIAPSIDRQRIDSGVTAPRIQIGIALAGVPKALLAANAPQSALPAVDGALAE